MIKSKFMHLIVYYLLLSSLSLTIASNQTLNKLNDPWWRNAVIYQAYIRSFCDSNNDGIGDIPGLISKLDYLQDLGIDALWLSPCNPSPMHDFGYDITDYYSIEPSYGTLQDFEHLIEEANKRNIKIIMDLVLNHTSDQHSWFKEALSRQDSPKRDWYIWRTSDKEPNNWTSLFGGSAWKKDAISDQYYYHFYFECQPDLNYNNDQVYQEMIYSIPRYWLNKGVSGFRLDAITNIFKDSQLRDNPQTKLRPDGSWEQIPLYNCNLPQVHDTLKDLRKVTDTYSNRALLGETESEHYLTPLGSLEERITRISEYFGNNDELHLVMNFFFSYIDKLSVSDFKKHIKLWDNNPKMGYPLYLFSNHDCIRHIDRYNPDKSSTIDSIDIAKLLATLLFTLRGTAQIYYGEEIGMNNNNPTTKDAIQDPVGKVFYPDISKCRDGARCPMQWSDNKYAGFSTQTPWMPVHPNYTICNVTKQQSNPNSLLNWYKSLIKLKKTMPALCDGTYQFLEPDNDQVFSYIRQSDTQIAIIILNFSANSEKVTFDSDLDLKVALEHKALHQGKSTINNKSTYSLELGSYGSAIFISS